MDELRKALADAIEEVETFIAWSDSNARLARRERERLEKKLAEWRALL